MNIKSVVAVTVLSGLSSLTLAQAVAPAVAVPAAKVEGATAAAAPAVKPASTAAKTTSAAPATAATEKTEAAKSATKVTAPAQKDGRVDNTAPAVVSKGAGKAS